MTGAIRKVFVLGLAVICSLQGTVSMAAEQPAVGAEEAKWKKDLQNAKVSRNTMLIIGTGATVAGFALVVGGLAENRSAGDVPGCSISGDTVTCASEAGRAEAQSRIDSGDKKAATGIVVGLVGGVLVLGGAIMHGKARNLETMGRDKGYSWRIDLDRTQTAWLRLDRTF